MAGDSFVADWKEYYPDRYGWANMMSEVHEVTNVAQAGVGEYKIFKQIENQDISNYDFVIVSHGTPNRLHTKTHPIHHSGFQINCDLFYNDIDRFSWFNRKLAAAKGWFKYYFDDEYYEDIYILLRQQIKNLIPEEKYISTSHTRTRSKIILEDHNINFCEVFENYRGNANHYNEEGNRIVFDRIQEEIYNRKNNS